MLEDDYRNLLALVRGLSIGDEGLASRILSARKEEEFKAQSFIKESTAQGGAMTALIPVRGLLTPYAASFESMSGMTSIESLSESFMQAVDDPRINQIVLMLDSAGGQIVDLIAFTDMIFESRSKKKIYAYVNGMAASAAYVIAASTHEIIMAETAMVGSLGVMMSSKPKEDGQIDIISSQSPNKNKDASTDEGRAQAQALVDDMADVIIERVATYRGVSKESLLNYFGGGKMFVAKNAVVAKMADKYNSFKSWFSSLSAEQKESGEMAQFKASLESLETDLKAMDDTMTENAALKAQLDEYKKTSVDAKLNEFIASLEGEQLITPKEKDKFTAMAKSMTEDQRADLKLVLQGRGKQFQTNPSVNTGSEGKTLTTVLKLPDGAVIDPAQMAILNKATAVAEAMIEKNPKLTMADVLPQALEQVTKQN